MPNWKKVIVSGSDASLNSLFVTNAVTASTFSGSHIGPLTGTSSWAINALTASYFAGSVSAFPYTGSARITGSLGVTGSIGVSGSTGVVFFSNADTMTLTGSFFQTGSTVITGSLSVTNGITGSLLGTASWALNALTASFVPSSSLTGNFFIQGGNSFGAQALLGTNDVQNLAFETSGSVRMTISSSGNIGIGTTTPTSSLLQVQGNVSASSYTGSLFGTSSWAVSSSFASVAASAPLYTLVSVTGSMLAPYTLNSVTSSMSVLSASYASSSTSASFASTAASAPLYTLVSVTGSMLAPYVLNSVTSSMSVLSASYAQTSSYANNFTVSGTLSVQTLIVQTITSSVDFVTGSTRFGSLIGNTHVFTGSISVSGSITGTAGVINSLTASNATNAVTASYALTATSASFASTASLAPLYTLVSATGSMLAPYTLNSVTASMLSPYVLNSVTSSMSVLSASYASGSTSASFASTASFIPASSLTGNFFVQGGNSFSTQATLGTNDSQSLALETSGSIRILISGSGNIGIGTITPTSSLLQVQGNVSASSFTGSLFGTASFATSASQASTSSYILLAVSASYASGSTSASFASQAVNASTASFVTTAQTASYVLQAVSASFATLAQTAQTASFVNTLNQNVLITGSLTIGSSSLGANENTLVLGPSPAGGSGEGGQILLQASGGQYTSASMIDNWQNYTRLLRGTNAGSDAVVTQWNMHTKQVSFPQYNSTTAFIGTTLIGLLGFDSNGNILTTTTGSGGGAAFPYSGTAVISGSLIVTGSGASTGSITSTGPIYSLVNGAMYFRGGDDAEFWDINVANTVGIYGQQNADRAGLKLGSAGPTLFGSGSNLGIGTITPSLALLQVQGNVSASSYTGSLFGTSSWAVSASFVTSASNAITASYGNATSTVGFGIGGSQIYYASVLSSTSPVNQNVFTNNTGSFTSAFYNYTVYSGSNARSGQISAVWVGTTVAYNDYSTVDIGSTSAVTASVIIATGQVQLNVQVPSSTAGWNIKATATYI